MMLPSPQIKLIFVLTIICVEAKKPPGYMEPPKVPDPNPPKYEYGYAIADGKGDGQGKQEQRDGIYALGRYYVQGKGSRQNVQYFADDWGYHPVVEFSSTGPHSRVTSHFALGEEAVKQLKNKENNLPQLQGILENADKLAKSNTVLSSPDQQQQTNLNEPQQILLQQEAKTVSPTPTTISTLETFQQQDLQTQALQTSRAQQEQLEDQTLIQIEPRNQQELQDQTQQTQQERQSEQLVVFQSQLEGQPKEELQQQTEHLQQELHNSLQEQYDTTTQIVEGNQQSQLQLLQQEQIQQIFVQQPQIQQQVSIQDLQLNPQQAILKHEEPTQKIIFPQEQRVEDISQDVYQKQHLQDNTISSNGATNQQIVYVQNQQTSTQPQEQLLIQTNIIHTQPEKDSQQTSVEDRQYETAALFENSDSKLVNTQQLTNDDRHIYNEPDLSTANYDFGSKLTTIQDTTNKLIEHTKNLVTGQDVLNINEAIFKNHNAITDSGASSSIGTEYTNSQLTSSESATDRFSYSDVGYSSTTPIPLSEPSLSDHPIVVADFGDNTVQSTTERFGIKTESQKEYYSSTSVAEENIASNSIEVTEPSTILVTPRPISTNFLAPITAGIQLQNIELQGEERKNSGNVNYNVEIQKSVPYYLGKFEYPSVYEQDVRLNETANAKSSAEIKATENIELGKTLLFFPGQSSPKVQIRVPNLEVKRPHAQGANYVTIQNVPSTTIKDNFVELDQQQAQGIHHQVAIQHINQQQPQGYQYHVGNTNLASLGQVGQKNTEITKVIHKPYPVRVPYEVPYPVIKQVQVPVTVQRIVEKPIHITKYVEKPVPIPQPYPVEKIVDRPVHIPVHVTKYIDRPYPVEVRVPYPQPYPVEKVVQKIVKQPYPVEVRVPVHVEKIVEKKVPVPHYIERPVEKIVEKPVPHYVDRPVPVEVKVPVPQPYFVRVEVPKPYPVDGNKVLQNSYGIVQTPHLHGYFIPQKGSSYQSVQVSVPQQIYSHHSYTNSQQEQQAQQSQQSQTYFYANPYAYAPQINHYLPPKHEIILNNGYLPSKPNNYYLPPKKDCNLHTAEASIKSLYYTIRPDNFMGLLPPKLSRDKTEFIKKLRTARSNFDDKSVRMEYGFLPPLIPSLEIDEQGNPIEKGEK